MNTTLRTPLAMLTTLAVGALACTSAAAQAQQPAPKTAHNVLQLSATGQAQATQDWLNVTLAVQHEGSEARAVQAELQRSLDAALQKIRPSADGDKLRVETSSFGVYPSYHKNKARSWTGRAELLLQGNDFARILQAAEHASGMSIARMDFDLSHQARSKLEQQAQAEAIARFKARAQDIVKAFGLSSYTLGEVHISGDAKAGDMHMPQMRTASFSKMVDSVEPGQARVHITVSGSVHGR